MDKKFEISSKINPENFYVHFFQLDFCADFNFSVGFGIIQWSDTVYLILQKIKGGWRPFLVRGPLNASNSVDSRNRPSL